MIFDVLMPGTNRAPTYAPFAHSLQPAEYRHILEVVDGLSFTTVLVCEHVAMPLHEVPRLGRHWDEPLAMMAFIAGVTRRVRIDAAVLVAPLHHPLRLAKALATIDQLSEGRVNISVGVGHAEQEFTAMGVPFTERGAIADEVLDALVALWSTNEPEYHGRYFNIEGLAVEPQPFQRPRPPIYVGGNSRPALRRAARFDGWQPNPTRHSLPEIAPMLDYIREQPSFRGKDETFDVNWLNAPAGVDVPSDFGNASATQLRAYRDQLVDAYCGEFRELGVTRAVADAPLTIASVAEYLDWLRWFDAEVVPAVG